MTTNTRQPGPLHAGGMPRRVFLASVAALAAPAMAQPAARDAPVFAEVWKDPHCGCCTDWVRHLQAHGFRVKVNDTGNAAIRARLGVAPRYASCHTALIGGYAIEGHVPARDIRRLLERKPRAVGLSVPGMPVGSPGMDGPAYGGRQDAFQVMLLAPGGGASVWQAYPAGKA